MQQQVEHFIPACEGHWNPGRGPTGPKPAHFKQEVTRGGADRKREAER